MRGHNLESNNFISRLNADKKYYINQTILNMIKKIFLASLMAICMAGFSVSAQDTAPFKGKQSGKCAMQERECKPNRMAPFAELGLSPEQTQKIELLNQKEAEARKAKFEAAKAERQAKKVDGKEAKEEKKQQKLSPQQAKAKRAEMMAKRQEGVKTYLADLQKILTPEQYVKFLENSYVQAHTKAGKASCDKGSKGKKHAKAGKQGKQGKKERKEQPTCLPEAK